MFYKLCEILGNLMYPSLMLSLVITLLSSEIAVIKTEVHTNRTEEEYQENAPSNFYVKASNKRIYKGCGICG